MKLQRMAVICILGALVLLAVFYYAIDPAQNVWVPKCAFHTLTGFSCPACGSQRALHALLHGRWQEAIAFNWFLIVSIPYLLLVLYTRLVRSKAASRLRLIVQHPRVVQSYAIAVIGWWIVRNLP